jgi:hypothetical protein
MLYTAIISFAFGLIAGWLIAVNNVRKSEAAKAEGLSLVEKAKALWAAIVRK